MMTHKNDPQQQQPSPTARVSSSPSGEKGGGGEARVEELWKREEEDTCSKSRVDVPVAAFTDNDDMDMLRLRQVCNRRRFAPSMELTTFGGGGGSSRNALTTTEVEGQFDDAMDEPILPPIGFRPNASPAFQQQNSSKDVRLHHPQIKPAPHQKTPPPHHHGPAALPYNNKNGPELPSYNNRAGTSQHPPPPPAAVAGGVYPSYSPFSVPAAQATAVVNATTAATTGQSTPRPRPQQQKQQVQQHPPSSLKKRQPPLAGRGSSKTVRFAPRGPMGGPHPYRRPATAAAGGCHSKPAVKKKASITRRREQTPSPALAPPVPDAAAVAAVPPSPHHNEPKAQSYNCSQGGETIPLSLSHHQLQQLYSPYSTMTSITLAAARAAARRAAVNHPPNSPFSVSAAKEAAAPIIVNATTLATGKNGLTPIAPRPPPPQRRPPRKQSFPPSWHAPMIAAAVAAAAASLSRPVYRQPPPQQGHHHHKHQFRAKTTSTKKMKTKHTTSSPKWVQEASFPPIPPPPLPMTLPVTAAKVPTSKRSSRTKAIAAAEPVAASLYSYQLDPLLPYHHHHQPYHHQQHHHQQGHRQGRTMVVTMPSTNNNIRERIKTSFFGTKLQHATNIAKATVRIVGQHPSDILIPDNDVDPSLRLQPIGPPIAAADGANTANRISAHDIRDKDLLMGKGPWTNIHKGNIAFRQLVVLYLPAYAMAQKRSKGHLARNIVLYLRLLGVRFLQKAAAPAPTHPGQVYAVDFWLECGDAGAQAKVMQGLRDGINSLMKRQARIMKSSQQPTPLHANNSSSDRRRDYHDHSSSSSESKRHKANKDAKESFHNACKGSCDDPIDLCDGSPPTTKSGNDNGGRRGGEVLSGGDKKRRRRHKAPNYECNDGDSSSPDATTRRKKRAKTQQARQQQEKSSVALRQAPELLDSTSCDNDDGEEDDAAGDGAKTSPTAATARLHLLWTPEVVSPSALLL